MTISVPPHISEAATILWSHWQASTSIGDLPAHCRPVDRAAGYAVQAEVARLSAQSIAGWKIAATSIAGQKHIGVDGPLAGRLLSDRVVDAGASVPIGQNLMRVAEAEFAFRLARPLPPRQDDFAIDEVMAAVDTLHPAIEVPDSRFDDFARVGAPQLIADTACACWVMIGPATSAPWRTLDLAAHKVVAHKNGALAAEGIGANVLGDPRIALTWIANELRAIGDGLRAGDVIITGTCVAPVPIAIGDRIQMNFGPLGSIDASFCR